MPLNLIAMIVSYLDDVADLARVCRTSRVLNYMTVPHLYNTITLTSYEDVRFRDDRPEGSGSASPFAMGLNALVTRNTAHLVRHLTLKGQWKEYDLEEYAKIGRVPDNAMMLNIAVRAALERCTGLESFTWDLNTKLLPSVYGGLVNLPRLKNLRIRFPSSRTPRPTTTVPAMPSLEHITITDIDPLCYQDDISMLLWAAKNIKRVTFHFSPRMREQNELSVHGEAYFKRFFGSKKTWKPKHVAIHNLLMQPHEPGGMDDWIDSEGIESITDIRGAQQGAATSSSFFRDTWKTPPPNFKPKIIRTDCIHSSFPMFLEKYRGLERFYLINEAPINLLAAPSTTHDPSSGTDGSPFSQMKTNMPSPTSTPTQRDPNSLLRDSYLNALINYHGASLVHLSLPSRWPLPLNMFSRLIRAAPNLTQLSVAVEPEAFAGLRLILPFLQKLRVIRLLIPTEYDKLRYGCSSSHSFKEMIEQDDEVHIKVIGRELVDEDGSHVCERLKYAILGWKIFELGPIREVDIPVGEVSDGCSVQTLVDQAPSVRTNGYMNLIVNSQNAEKDRLAHAQTTQVKIRAVKRIPVESVRDIEIIIMDTYDIVP